MMRLPARSAEHFRPRAFIISGLTVSAGAGLAVTVAAGVASIGGRITASVSFSIAGLADNTTNHLYWRDSGAGTSNTSGTQPADTVKLGTATTSGGVVTSVGSNWASGRQTKRRTEDLVHGSGAGHPRAVDLASWHATNNEGNEVKGVLPAGAVTTSDTVVLVNATGGAVTLTLPAAASHSGLYYRIKKIDSSANTVVIDGNASETIDGGLTATMTMQYEAIDIVCDGSNWFIF
jgi:hypothetical protein